MRQQDAIAARDGRSARALHAARLALARIAPQLSARRRLYFTQMLFGATMIASLVLCARVAPGATAAVLRAAAFAIFSVLTLWRLLAAAAVLAPRKQSDVRWTAPLPIYTVLCPLYREDNMVGILSRRLAQIDYPTEKLDIKLILEADDAETIDAANRVAWPAHVQVIIVPPGRPRTKPKALNYALTFARGAFVTVYDAEDAPHPGQLRAALDAFAGGGPDLGCVQAPLLIDNARMGWLPSQFAAEYAIQFDAVLPLLARLGFPLMLGGTSNHFRTHALTSAGAWDPFNVTEDADIGYRLARDGWRFAMIAPPTWEEAPISLPAAASTGAMDQGPRADLGRADARSRRHRRRDGVDELSVDADHARRRGAVGPRARADLRDDRVGAGLADVQSGVDRLGAGGHGLWGGELLRRRNRVGAA
jgi:cellulose synthase/poly-beta-1,6-N-acetylglucosamine synthase-like glycosyltransferase